MTLTPLRIAFIVIALLSALGNGYVPSAFKAFRLTGRMDRWEPQTILCGVFHGLLIGEFIAIAFWILFDSISLPKKLLLGTFLGCFLAACFIAGLQVWPGMPMSIGILILAVGSSFPLVFAGLFYGVERLTCAKMVRSKLAFESAGRSQQYGVGFLLAVMVAVALGITIVRSVLPVGGSYNWLSTWEYVFIGLWFVLLAIGVTLFIWFPFVSVLQPTRVNIWASLLLAVLGPSFFLWISSFVLIGGFKIQSSSMFPALPQSISFGLLASSLLLGVLIKCLGGRQICVIVARHD